MNITHNMMKQLWDCQSNFDSSTFRYIPFHKRCRSKSDQSTIFGIRDLAIHWPVAESKLDEEAPPLMTSSKGCKGKLIGTSSSFPKKNSWLDHTFLYLLWKKSTNEDDCCANRKTFHGWRSVNKATDFFLPKGSTLHNNLTPTPTPTPVWCTEAPFWSSMTLTCSCLLGSSSFCVSKNLSSFVILACRFSSPDVAIVEPRNLAGTKSRQNGGYTSTRIVPIFFNKFC